MRRILSIFKKPHLERRHTVRDESDHDAEIWAASRAIDEKLETLSCTAQSIVENGAKVVAALKHTPASVPQQIRRVR